MHLVDKIYAVVHMRTKWVGGVPAQQQEVSARWFDDLIEAERAFENCRLDSFVISNEEGSIAEERDSKQIYAHAVSERARSLITADSRYDPERLAWELSLKPDAGLLLRQEPKLRD